MKIVITGSGGQLAQALLSIAKLAKNDAELSTAEQMLLHFFPEIKACIEPSDEVVGVSHQVLDIGDIDSIRRALDTIAPDVVINCAAYNAVDKAEIDIDMAMAVNAIGPKLLASECRLRHLKLVHISTDFVFDGELSRAYTEQELSKPLSVYGKSKREGERWVSEILGEQATIIRTSWLYSCYGDNFVKTMQSLFKTKESLSVVSDQLGSPTWCEALAVVILMLIKQKKLSNTSDGNSNIEQVVYPLHQEKGVAHLYHYAGGSCTSWYEFAGEIQRRTQVGEPVSTESASSTVACKIEPITTLAWQRLHENRLAIRPAQSALNAAKVNQLLGIESKSLISANWQQQLEAMLKYQKVKSEEGLELRKSRF
ncbi:MULTISPECIES: dTDP-4-dehydrorhamnose reductase [unclassified Shewanella]|uniref:dTDP-4-dehydrorhamnose reductase n=1 Tax=unclassified Shewanella TaxID=196818 RepID=UPI001BC1EEF0|nr:MULTISPECIES: dTDP-4-dehydrorhamnose reductase [unclassified Shewanella]GIU18179.1 NAD(P)-dependent oxidoreductase [Shewanella sp. MBTL60-112-B1]GIU38984.1 NAD(P)-dependent oxidoreductase [Shewanella sp. MBTL60-112-B2]